MSGPSYWMSAALGLLTSIACAAEPEFQFMRPIELSERAQEELISVPLDSEIYDNTQTDLDDLRLRNESGEAVPFLIRQKKSARPQTIRREWTADEMTAQPLEEGGLEIHLILDREAPAPNGLTLVTPLVNFEKRVRVETSTDGQTWQEVAESTIFDYSRYVDVRQVAVSFPQTERRHIRIRIENVTVSQESELLELTRQLQGTKEISRQERLTIRRRPFRIDKVVLWQDRTQEVAQSAVKQTYSVREFGVEQIPEEQQTEIQITMRQEPLTQFTIETPERNFSRRARVEVEETDGLQRRWRTVGEATLTRIDFKDLNREQLSIPLRETRARKFRIVVENRDSPPLEITDITAEGNVYEAIFLATPDHEYRLVYGDADSKPAQYDTQVLEELLQAGYGPRSAELGEPQPHATAEGPTRFEWSEVLNNRMVLFAIICVLVLVLGISLYRASRRLDEPTSEPPNEAP